MQPSDVQRKLVAILCTDVVGYSRLMGEDHEGTLKSLTACREIFSSKIEAYGGRVVNAPGDSLLAEFSSVVNAVSCAVDVQRDLAERNQDLPDPRRMDFRIGVNLGDVLIQEGDLYGDGVNVAARLESLADPGGICISGSVHEQVKSRLPFRFDFIGEQQVKNIAEPVKTFRVHPEPGEGKIGSSAEKPPIPGGAPHDKPSIAILPFDTMSSDPEQMYFADGIVEDLITELSKFRWFDVIARNSTYIYKGQAVELRQVSRDLGVRYVVEGSIRNLGEKVRITIQLIEGATGMHIWAERFDSNINDIFEVQDEITSQIVGSLNPEIFSAEASLAKRKVEKNPDVWSLAVRGRWHVTRLTKEDAIEAKRYLNEALALNPNHVPTLAFLTYSHITDVFFGLSESPPESIKMAQDFAQKAISLDENDPWVQCAQGMTYFIAKDPDQAVIHFRRAIELNPNFAIAYGYLSLGLAYGGEPEPAIEAGSRAIRLSPRDPELAHFYIGIGTANFIAETYEKAVEFAEKTIRVRPNAPSGHRLLATSLSYLGKSKEARSAIEALLALNPKFTVTAFKGAIHFKHPEHAERFLKGLSHAGLPD